MKMLDRYQYDRLTSIQSKIEDIRLDFKETVIIIGVHSHAKLSECLNSITAKTRHVISLPCCVADDLNNPDIAYRDDQCFSPENRINIYLNR
jgi:hypothetical protein